MSRGICEYAAKHGRIVLLIVVAVSIGIIGAYVAYPYSDAERVMMAKISRSAATVGLAGFFQWTPSDQ
jgi:nitrogen fixation-related uncharacterized protein